MLAQLGAEATVRDPASDLAKSTKTINGWIGRAMLELDEKLVECDSQQHILLQGAAQASSDVQELSAETSYIRTELLRAADEYPEDKEYFSSLKEQEGVEKRSCKQESDDHVLLVRSARESRDRLQQVRQLVAKECPKKASLLQESSAPSAAALGAGHAGILQVAVDAVRSSAAMASNTTAASSGTRGIQERLRRSAASWASFLQVAESMGRTRRLRTSSSRASSAAGDKAKYCAYMGDMLGTLQGQVEDDMSLLEEDRLKFMHECEEQRQLERREISRTAHKRSDVSQHMTEATARLGTLTARTRGRDAERSHLAEVMATQRLRCKKEVNDILHLKLCGLVRLRDQLWLSAKKKELPQDCEVTEWVDGECSKSCGGGLQVARRQVLLKGWEGAACPPLTMERRCNEEKCPDNCMVSMWSGWSACSAACDRGIQERTRNVLTKERHGGEPCPELVEMRACSSGHACARDCELADWTKWSHCSQACAGGTQVRLRHVSRPPAGLGRCAAEDDATRLQRRACNRQKCSVAVDKFTCADLPVDLMIVVDVGGSLGQEGFDTMKKLALEVVKRSRPGDAGLRVGVLSVADDAKVVIDLSSKAGDIEGKVKSDLTWRRGTTKLHLGITRADSMLDQAAGTRGGSLAPRGAPMVLVLTDGFIADPFLTTKAVQKYRGTGVRLLFGVFGGSALGDKLLFSKLASTPAKENLVLEKGGLKSIKANLTSVAGVILRRVCGAVAPSE